MLNKKKIEKHIKALLKEFDPNPDRPGLVETPKRVAKYWCELLEGAQYSNEDIAKMFDKCFEDAPTGGLVIEKNIPIFSHCEHHLALMYDCYVSIAYIPNDRVIGLSKMARIAEMVGKRLQLQERICSDICEVMKMIVKTDNVAVIITGKHGCMTARGVKSRESVTESACLSGAFKENAALRAELYSRLKQ